MTNIEKVCIVGASGKLGQYMVQHALEKGYEVGRRLPGGKRGQTGWRTRIVSR